MSDNPDLPVVLESRKRAELRGLEATARSKINIGVWTARLFGASNLLAAIAALSIGDIKLVATSLIIGSGLLLMSHRIARGHRVEPAVMAGLFMLATVLSPFIADRAVTMTLINLAGAIGFGIGARGVFALHRVREEQQAALVEFGEERQSLL